MTILSPDPFWIMLDRDEPEVDGLPVFDW
ncbi:DUF5983 family protein [Sphingomonas sp. XXL09]